MKKNNKPLRIILLIFIIEIAVVGVIGFLFQNKIADTENKIETGEISTEEEVKNSYDELSKLVTEGLII